MTVCSFVTRPRSGLRCAGMLLALAGTATAQCPPDAQYLRPIVWAHGGKVLEMVSGDLDLDGSDEIVVLGLGGLGQQILPGEPDGHIGEPIPFQATGALRNPRIADVMGDARPELIGLTGTRLVVYTFPADAEPWEYAVHETTTNRELRSPVAGDLNHDGFTDVVVHTHGSGKFEGLRTLLGDGTGGFVTGYDLFAPERMPHPRVLHDINGDGHLDLLATTSWDDLPGLQYFPGVGDGTLGAAQNVTPVASVNSAVVVGLRGDGTTEVALTSRTTDLIEFWSIDATGTGTLLNTIDVGTHPRDLSIADVDGDGFSDLLVLSESTQHATVLYGTGSDGYERTRLPVSEVEAGILPRRRGPDGAVDLAAAMNTARELVILEGRAGERAPWNRAYPCGNYSFIGTSADFTADGIPDLAIHSLADRELVVLENDGAGRFKLYERYVAPPLTASMVVADLNEDGIPDVVMASRDEARIEFRPGRPLGGLGEPVVINAEFVTFSLASADFTGDGHLDLVLQDDATRQFVVLIGDGAGGFTTGPQSLPVNGVAREIDVADLNHDDILDLVVQGNFASDTLHVVLGAGEGAFQHPVAYPSIGGDANAVLHDFNGDGHIDCAVGRDTGSRVFIHAGDGTGALTWDRTIELDDIGVIRGIARRDLNGDGRDDLAVAASIHGAGTFVAVNRSSDGTFVSSSPVRLAAEPSAFIMNDFNGDGAADFAVVGRDSDQVTVLLGQCHVCRGDLDVSFSVGMPDVLLLLQAWGPCGVACAADLDGNGVVGMSDLFTILSAWGPCAFDPYE